MKGSASGQFLAVMLLASHSIRLPVRNASVPTNNPSVSVAA